MSAKILSVDDSKAVRVIVKKAFKTYDVDLVEATNGVEGLAAAQKETPELILLDVTMPVMDGVEMLGKLKSDAALKGIPVIMLTAEAGRENVMKIAKMGIRDYIVKPFKEDNLIDKVAKVVDLQPKQSADGPKKNAGDGLDIIVVEDKPAIIKQISNGFTSEKWNVHGLSNATEAIDFCSKTIPDLAMISVSLPGDDALNFFRFMRSNDTLKYIPAFGMAVKTAEEDIEKARNSGITQIVTKPIDFKDLENRIVRALNLDVSDRYFKMDDEAVLVTFPNPVSAEDIKQIDNYLKPKISDAVDNGLTKIVVDMSQLEGVDMKVITLVAAIIENCTNLGLNCGLVGNDIVVGECSGIEDSTEWSFFDSVDEAKAGL